MLRAAVVAALAFHGEAIVIEAAPAPAAAGAPGAPGAPGTPEIQYSKDFKEDWHNEWRNGDYPSWKKVIKVDGIEGWEDRQSDGKPGFLQAAPAPGPAAPAGMGGASGMGEMAYPKE